MSDTQSATESASEAQTTIALKILAGLIVFGALLVLIYSAFSGIPSPGRFAFLGLVSGLAALGLGAALGLLFGLPTSRTVPELHRGESDGVGWYADSTSLEQISDWLVKIIVGVTLTQFDAVVARFERASAALTRGMVCPTASACGAEVGGFLLASFFVLGFLTSYLWMRRYFMGELVQGRGEAVRRERAVLSEAEHAGAVQAKPGTAEAAGLRRLALEPTALTVDPLTGHAIEPGDFEDDPWKGVFGGSSGKEGVFVSAKVEPLRHKPGLFDVELLITVDDAQRRSDYDGRRASLFLHPTFREMVQSVKIRHGRGRLTLVAYGAFTVGVLFPDGLRLELDLAELPDAPNTFRDS